jgi:hypothetical protein
MAPTIRRRYCRQVLGDNGEHARQIDEPVPNQHLLNRPKRLVIARARRQQNENRSEANDGDTFHVTVLVDRAATSQQVRITLNNFAKLLRPDSFAL